MYDVYLPASELCKCARRRFPVVLAVKADELEAGEAVPREGEPPPLLQLTFIGQPGLPRRQVYYPFLAFRTSRMLQVLLKLDRSQQTTLSDRCALQFYHLLYIGYSPCSG